MTALPDVAAFRKLVVDPASGRVFVAAASSGGGVVEVLDCAGHLLGTITEPGWIQSVVPYRGVLYVGFCCGGSGIDEYDPITLAKIQSLAPIAAFDLTEAGGALWATSGGGSLTRIDPSTGETTVFSLSGDQAADCDEYFATSPTITDRLVIYPGGSQSCKPLIWSVDTSSGTPVVTASAQNSFYDAALESDGRRLVGLDQSDRVEEWTLDPLQPDGVVFPSGLLSVAATQSHGGMVVMAASALDEFVNGSSTPFYSGAGPVGAWPRGLAFSPDGAAVFDLSRDASSGTFILVTYVTQPAWATPEGGPTPRPPPGQ